MLERAGYRVLSAADGPQALATWAIQRDQIDRLLTDMVMPNGMTGRELAELMLADRPELAVISASGYGPGMAAPGFCDSQRGVSSPNPIRRNSSSRRFGVVLSRTKPLNRFPLKHPFPFGRRRCGEHGFA